MKGRLQPGGADPATLRHRSLARGQPVGAGPAQDVLLEGLKGGELRRLTLS